MLTTHFVKSFFFFLKGQFTQPTRERCFSRRLPLSNRTEFYVLRFLSNFATITIQWRWMEFPIFCFFLNHLLVTLDNSKILVSTFILGNVSLEESCFTVKMLMLKARSVNSKACGWSREARTFNALTTKFHSPQLYSGNTSVSVHFLKTSAHNYSYLHGWITQSGKNRGLQRVLPDPLKTYKIPMEINNLNLFPE